MLISSLSTEYIWGMKMYLMMPPEPRLYLIREKLLGKLDWAWLQMAVICGVVLLKRGESPMDLSCKTLLTLRDLGREQSYG
jgi:hypothetical protein